MFFRAPKRQLDESKKSLVNNMFSLCAIRQSTGLLSLRLVYVLTTDTRLIAERLNRLQDCFDAESATL
jgi:hypothetical protein